MVDPNNVSKPWKLLVWAEMILAYKMSTISVHDNSSEISYSRKKDQVEMKGPAWGSADIE